MSKLENNSSAETDFQEFAYAVSHDFNAPLRAIIQFSRILAEENRDKLDEEAQEYLDLIMVSGTKMHCMLEGLLEFSRLDSQAKPLRQIDSAIVLQEAALVLATEISTSQTRIHTQNLPMMNADHDQLLQLFIILLRNAMLYQPKGQNPEITVSCQQDGVNLSIYFDDNGIGVNENYRERVFRPFQRLHNERDYPGIGMGLTLARKIARRHQGALELASNPLGGLRVKFCLPENLQEAR